MANGKSLYQYMLDVRHARISYEKPVADELERLGCKALVTEGTPKQNRETGDVLFCPPGYPSPIASFTYTIEIQVSEKHTNFSYTANKITKYKGFGRPERRFVMLGCLDGPTDKLFVIVKADELHDDLVKHLSPVNGEYYVIFPSRLSTYKELYIGRSPEEAARKMVESLPDKPWGECSPPTSPSLTQLERALETIKIMERAYGEPSYKRDVGPSWKDSEGNQVNINDKGRSPGVYIVPAKPTLPEKISPWLSIADSTNPNGAQKFKSGTPLTAIAAAVAVIFKK
jgi:hypothetical protein